MKECFITFSCGITQKSVTSLISAISNCADNGMEKITVHLSSTGGGLLPAFSAYHFLRSVNIPLVMHNAGNVESSAVLLYLAADTRIAAPHSRFLLHPFTWNFNGDIPAPVIRNCLASLDFDSRRYGDIFNERTNGADKPIDVFKCLNGEPLVIGAEESRHCGLSSEKPAVYTTPAGAIHSLIVET
jgi:ATP-dependent protease ClpP protease subunit